MQQKYYLVSPKQNRLLPTDLVHCSIHKALPLIYLTEQNIFRQHLRAAVSMS